jgi:ABC-2 type transport system permease protein
MNSFCAVFKRELKSYFATPLAYVFLVIFLFFAGYLTFSKQGFFEARQADMQPFFVNLPLLFIFMVPATAMRLWAEERKVGSIELLFTLPITITQAVLGKFLAAWAFLGIALALTFPMVITVAYLGDPDKGLIVIGSVNNSSIEPTFRSSAHRRIAVAGTMKMNSSGRFTKNGCMSACRASKNPCLLNVR